MPAVLGAPLTTAMTRPASILLNILTPRDLSVSQALAALLLPNELPLDLWHELLSNFSISFLLPVDDIVTLGSPSLMHQQHSD